MTKITTWDDLGKVLNMERTDLKNKVYYLNRSRGLSIKYKVGGSLAEIDTTTFLNNLGRVDLLERVEYPKVTTLETVAEFNSEVEKLKSEKQELNSKVEFLNSEVEKSKKFNSEVEKLKSEKQELNSKVEFLNSEVEKLKSEKQELNSKVEFLNSEVEKSKKFNSEVEKLKSEKQELNSKVEFLNSEVEKLKSEKQELNSEVEKSKKFNSEVEKLKSEKQELNSKVEFLNSEVEKSKKLNSKVEFLNSEVEKSKKLNSEVEKLKSDNEKLNSEVEKLKSENQRLIESFKNSGNLNPEALPLAERILFTNSETFRLTTAMTFFSIIVMGISEFKFLENLMQEMSETVKLGISGLLTVLFQTKGFDSIGNTIALNWLIAPKNEVANQSDTVKKVFNSLSLTNKLLASFALFLAFGAISELALNIFYPKEYLDLEKIEILDREIKTDSLLNFQIYESASKHIIDSVRLKINKNIATSEKVVVKDKYDVIRKNKFLDSTELINIREFRLEKLRREKETESQRLMKKRQNFLNYKPMKKVPNAALLLLPLYVYLLIFRINGFKVNAVKKYLNIKVEIEPLWDILKSSFYSFLRVFYIKK